MTIADVPFKENLVDWLWIAAGVVLGVVWPWLFRRVKAIIGVQTAASFNFGPYLIIGAFAAATAIIVLAIYRYGNPDEHIIWYAGLLAGYGWQAVLEKWKNDYQGV